MGRSVRASMWGAKKIREKFELKGWTQETFGALAGVSRPTVSNFLKRKPVDKESFQNLCSALDLNWQEMIEIASDQDESCDTIDDLVQRVREQVSEYVESQCSTTRVIVLSHPLEIEPVYTRVKLLEKPIRLRRAKHSELAKGFDRNSLSSIHQEGVKADDVVEQHQKLLLLGKPGAGKTTMLKRLALLCLDGDYKKDNKNLVPVFISIKNWVESGEHQSLFDYITHQWSNCGIKDSNHLDLILRDGSALILLDGLDETNLKDRERISEEIRKFCGNFYKCQIIVTCRTSAERYIFDHFTEIEVANFSDSQISIFSRKWFKANGHEEKSEVFQRKLFADLPIKELASNPLLLTLLCSVYEEIDDFPQSRSELYREAFNILLRKRKNYNSSEWDNLYKDLSLSMKYQLLGKLAFETFSNNEYWFRRDTVKKYLYDYIKTEILRERANKLEIEIEAMLHSIESHHGLVIERYRSVFSFSHLAFQEFLSAFYIVETEEVRNNQLQELASYTTEPKWREVILLTAEMLPSADELLLMVKENINSLFAEDERLQEFLNWIQQKQISSKTTYISSAVRAFYFTLALPIGNNLYRDFSLVQSLDSNFYQMLDSARDLNRNVELKTEAACFVIIESDFELGSDVDFVLEFDLLRTLDRTCIQGLNGQVSYPTIPLRDLDCLANNSGPALKKALQKLKSKLPNVEDSDAKLEEWWRAKGDKWVKSYRGLLETHRNIGQDWNFNDEQVEKLHLYYEATRLLVDCLNSTCKLSPSVREEIELSLLSPVR